MGFFRYIFASITLGLLCGWYYFLLILFPTLIYLSCQGSSIAASIFAVFILLSVTPLTYEPWEPFMYSWIFKLWRDYFDFSTRNARLSRAPIDELSTNLAMPWNGDRRIRHWICDSGKRSYETLADCSGRPGWKDTWPHWVSLVGRTQSAPVEIWNNKHL